MSSLYMNKPAVGTVSLASVSIQDTAACAETLPRRSIETILLFSAIFLLNLRGWFEAPWSLMLFIMILLIAFKQLVIEPLGIKTLPIEDAVDPDRKMAAIVSWLFFAWTGLTFLQGAFNGSYPFLGSFLQFLLLVGLFYLVLRVPVELPDGDSRARLKYHLGRTMFWSLLIYLFLNLVLWAAGVQTATPLEFDPGEARLLGLVGVTIRRVQFPLDASVNRVASTAACLFMLSLTCFAGQRGYVNRIKMTMGALTAICVMILCDARGAILACLLAPLFSAGLGKVWVRRSLPWIVVALPATPGLFYALFDLLPRDFLVDVISRSGNATGGAGASSGRIYIWSSVFARLYSDPGWHSFIGFGYLGHAISGISRDYAWIFHSISTVTFTTHNVYLQTVIDRGIVGLMLLLSMLFLNTRLLCEQAGNALQAGETIPVSVRSSIVLVMILTITACNEVILTSYSQDSLLLLMVIAATATRPDFTAIKAFGRGGRFGRSGLYNAGQ